MAKTQPAADTADMQEAVANEPVNTLAHYLVVRHSFDAYSKGDAIRDEATITAVLAGENAHCVHKVVA